MSLFMSKEEKEQLKKMEQEEKEWEKEFPPEKESFFDVMKSKNEDDDESYLSEEDIEEMKIEKKEERRLIIIVGTIFASIILVITIGLTIFSLKSQSDLLKITKPAILNYYKNNFKINIKIDSINNICIEDDCSDNILLTTKDNHHIITMDNKTFGDDYNTESIIEEYKVYLKENFENFNIITNNPIISYKDYYINYNINYEYIRVLPNSVSFDNLISSNKLTITDTIAYQGNYDFNNLNTLLNKLSDDSCFYLIKQEKGIPTNLTVMKKNSIVSLDITTNFKLNDNITYHELDRNKNNVTKVKVNSVKNTDIISLNNKIITNAYTIIPETNIYSDITNSYFLLQFDESILSNNKLVQIESNNDHDDVYNELEIINYKELILFNTGGSVYLIGNDKIGFGYIKESTPFWCKFNLC